MASPEEFPEDHGPMDVAVQPSNMKAESNAATDGLIVDENLPASGAGELIVDEHFPEPGAVRVGGKVDEESLLSDGPRGVNDIRREEHTAPADDLVVASYVVVYMMAHVVLRSMMY